MHRVIGISSYVLIVGGVLGMIIFGDRFTLVACGMMGIGILAGFAYVAMMSHTPKGWE